MGLMLGHMRVVRQGETDIQESSGTRIGQVKTSQEGQAIRLRIDRREHQGNGDHGGPRCKIVCKCDESVAGLAGENVPTLPISIAKTLNF